jgi:Predicted nucleic acid-binding protein, contains PIN domain
MRVYLDSSAIVKRVIEEPESEALENALEERATSGDQLVTSALSRVEVSRALRTRLDHEDPAVLACLCDDAFAGIGEYPLAAPVLALARRVGPPVLRSLDALHLASAVIADAHLIVAYDSGLLEASAEMGFVTASWE